MTNKDLADLIFPDINKTIDDYKSMYPTRENTGYVTRFAPSPTGFMHIGNFFQAMISYINAKNNNGVFFLRIEDTDQKRENKDAIDVIFKTLRHYGIDPDEYEENDNIKGNYGPYIQSERKEIYQTFIKYFISIGRAYPCFCSKDTLDNIRDYQKKRKLRIGYYGRFARCRDLDIEDVATRIKNGEQYVIRFRSMGDFDKKIKFQDEARGTIEMPENDLDIIIMKSDDKLPTYHFAHMVDDYLMHTTHVVRGEEWLSSVPIHYELFHTLGVDMPKYIHNPLILKKDNGILRKISKRKDPEATMSYYDEEGYPTYAVIESIMTIINSNYEAWREENVSKNYLDFPFDPQKMSTSGALYDIEKLNNISKNYLAHLNVNAFYEGLLNWTKNYDVTFNDILLNNKDVALKVLNIERDQENPRKDYAKYSDVKDHISYMFNEYFDNNKDAYEWQNINDIDEIKKILDTYINKYFDINDNQEDWFNKIKMMSDESGYASDMKEYKKNKEAYKGSVADISGVIRVALTKKARTPDLYQLMQILGEEEVKRRINLVG